MTNATIFRPIILLPRAIPAYHAISMLIRMIALRIMTLVAGKDFRAAAEAEPAIALAVVGTAAATGEFLAGYYAEGFFRLGETSVLEVKG